MPKPCAFCAIVAGDAPAHEVHRDEDTVAFLDVKPVFPGHVLLVPRRHVTTLAELPADEVPGFFALAQRLERAVETTMDAPGSLVLVNNVISQSVPHLHLHVIPRRPKDGLRFFLGPRHPYPDTDEAEAVAERIGASLRDLPPSETG
ncbi:HIT family protein [Actinomycetospora soli]|uniref:HIT family protein n=1 Tax=Actinomycetospora soli TaxID=2893887 RepID=UPI001E4B1B4E|nr:HIT family protein [Actinomycetospora soli]MCD2187042.1 HIT family protein [Actinomycetospora soli]